ncbi:MAG: LysM peptidoglycan-binding domain-containing M23 family metallopeptidase [Caulobacteraceae bacterium]|nr:LysM peptidoglycan-binding domain-containing M23 family metallopeptidase [Caulobacteraceae bacterium]
MTTRSLILAAALILPAAACQSVDVQMARPRYATRVENLPADWEKAAEEAPRGSVHVTPARPRYATRLENTAAPATSTAPAPRTEPAAQAAAPAYTPVSDVSRGSDRDPVIVREPIQIDELPPVADPSTPERGLSDPPRAATRAAPSSTRAPTPAPARDEDVDDDNGTDDRAAVPDRPQGQSRPAPTGATYQYVIQPGDTVAGIGRRFGVHAQTLIELNGLQPQGGIQAGRSLTLPATAREGGSDPYATGPTPQGMRSQTATAATTDMESGPRPARVAPPAPTPASAAGAVSAGRGRFIWPVRGDVILRFGAMGTSLRNDGINIAAPDGTPVKASADGEVVYAGSVIAAFGNYVLIKHADGWVTAYGYLSRIDVRMHQEVKQGQVIGAVGSTGGMSQPQLHFEIRYAPNPREKAAPVDPMPILR